MSLRDRFRRKPKYLIHVKLGELDIWIPTQPEIDALEAELAEAFGPKYMLYVTHGMVDLDVHYIR